MKIRNWKTGKVIYQAEVDTIKELVEKAVKEGVCLKYANIRNKDLKGANLSTANLERAYLTDTNLEGANLEGAELHCVHLRGANLEGANLRGADLSGADLEGANLECANLGDADLREADLRKANLYNADLEGASLEGANLEGANLRGADLSGADLSGANLKGADLNDADLNGADLSCANLKGANLYGADLRNAKNVPENLPMACPKDGSFIAWKKVNNKLVKLEIPEDAKRSSATSKKCRCDKAKVLAITDLDGTNPIHGVINYNYGATMYYVGEMVYPDRFDDDRWNECSNGIHFFMDKQDAVNYLL